MAETISAVPGHAVYLLVDGSFELIWSGTDIARAERIAAVINNGRRHAVATISAVGVVVWPVDCVKSKSMRIDTDG